MEVEEILKVLLSRSTDYLLCCLVLGLEVETEESLLFVFPT